MPILLLIRHGETDYVKLGKMAGRTPGVHLNDKGLLEASDLSEFLKLIPIASIYSSPMERAVETATPLAKVTGLKINITAGLLETDIGDWKGLELKKAGKLPEWKIVQNSPSRFRFPGGESFQEEQTRLVNAVEKIINSHKPEELVAAVSHADPIKLIISFYLGMPLDHFQRLACSTGSVSILKLDQNGAALLGLNLKPTINIPFHKKGRNK
jgi:probable phosphomutase (TIGR03848 family)